MPTVKQTNPVRRSSCRYPLHNGRRRQHHSRLLRRRRPNGLRRRYRRPTVIRGRCRPGRGVTVMPAISSGGGRRCDSRTMCNLHRACSTDRWNRSRRPGRHANLRRPWFSSPYRGTGRWRPTIVSRVAVSVHRAIRTAARIQVTTGRVCTVSPVVVMPLSGRVIGSGPMNARYFKLTKNVVPLVFRSSKSTRGATGGTDGPCRLLNVQIGGYRND